MKKIELANYEVNDLARILCYAKVKKKEDYANEKISKESLNYTLGSLDMLIMRLGLDDDALKTLYKAYGLKY